MTPRKATSTPTGITEQHAALCAASDQAVYNASKFCMGDLRSRGDQQQQFEDDADLTDGEAA